VRTNIGRLAMSNRRTLVVVARARSVMAAERAADVARLRAWYEGELSGLRKEVSALRAETNLARSELRNFAAALGAERDVDARLH
jgi:hypothetical protein